MSAQFPYPARSGFETRVYQLARQIAARHDLTLLSYVEPGRDDDVGTMREHFSVETVERELPSRNRRRLGQVFSVGSPQPFAATSIRPRELERTIERLSAARPFDVIQLESSVLSSVRLPRSSRVVLDEHNVEYEVFERMHVGERSPLRRSFNRLEGIRFRRFEQASWREAAGCVVTSEREQRIVRAHAPGTPTAIVPNGVDLDYFHPQDIEPEPRTAVFNGVLDYRPNVDAAYHVVDEIWPLLLERHPDAKLTIVGRGDAADLRRLERAGVAVTGQVPDIRPYLARAAAVLVPIRMGGGTRLKVVEGLAMAKAMVSTSLGCEGVNVGDGEELLIADGAAPFANAVGRLFDDPWLGNALGQAGRRRMESEYSWAAAGARLEDLYARVLNG